VVAAAAPALKKEFYRSSGVVVSNSRFIVGGQTYAIAGVTSVKNGRKDPNYGGAVFLGLIGLLFLVLGFGAGAPAVGFFGIVLVVITVVWWRSLKPDFSVMLTTSVGEVQALESKDGQYIGSVVAALNDAIVYRR
jgi:uncharacterized membrane protein